MNKYHIMAPGPTELPPSVLAAACKPIIHHRTKQFRSIFKEVSENLKSIFITDQPVLILSAGGTGGMESCIVNLSDPGETIIVICSGVFGERWAKIGESLGRNVIRIDVPWGKAICPEILEEKLVQYPMTVLVCGTLSETSTGIEHPIKDMASIIKKSSALFAVDVVSGLAACQFKMDEWEVDAAVAGTQKGLMCPPGLALIALSERAQKVLSKKKGPKFYWSYESALKSLATDPLPDTPWTPNITLIMQLQQAIHMILEESLVSVWERHQLLAVATRSGIEEMGLRVFNIESPSPAVTVIYSPDKIDSVQISKKMLEDWGISIIAGQGKIKNEVFRIGHIGYCDRTDILMTLAVLETVLSDLQVPIILGSGVRAAQEVFLKAKQREVPCTKY